MFGGLLGALIALKIVGYDVAWWWFAIVIVAYCIAGLFKTYLVVAFTEYIQELFKTYLNGGGA